MALFRKVGHSRLSLLTFLAGNGPPGEQLVGKFLPLSYDFSNFVGTRLLDWTGLSWAVLFFF